MEQIKLTGKDLREINFPEGKAIGVALEVMEKSFPQKTNEEKLNILRLIFGPESYSRSFNC
jgi:hypothetical protein